MPERYDKAYSARCRVGFNYLMRYNRDMAERGAPTKYDTKYCDEAIKWMAKEYSIDSFAGKIGVARATIYNWMKEYNEFLDAVKIGHAKAIYFWEKVANAATLGKEKYKNVNPVALIFQLKNRLGWIDRLNVVKRSAIDDMLEDEAMHEHGVANVGTLSQIVAKYGKELEVLDRVP